VLQAVTFLVAMVTRKMEAKFTIQVVNLAACV